MRHATSARQKPAASASPALARIEASARRQRKLREIALNSHRPALLSSPLMSIKIRWLGQIDKPGRALAREAEIAKLSLAGGVVIISSKGLKLKRHPASKSATGEASSAATTPAEAAERR